MIDYKKNSVIELLFEKEVYKSLKHRKDLDKGDKILISENEKKMITEKIKKEKLFSIIRDFLIHFGNFDLDLPISNDIILEISTEENLYNEQISYFVSFMN